MGKLRTTIGGKRELGFLVTLSCALAAGGALAAAAGSAPKPTPKTKKQATVVYVVARSGSMGATAGACGTRLACVRSAIAAANATLHGRSAVAWAGLATANPTLSSRDVDLGEAGVQLLVRPKHDGNANGKDDLSDALSRVSLGGSTCYACGLHAAQTAFAQSTQPSGHNVVVFIADRPNVSGAAISMLAGAFGADTQIHAIALGARTTCGAGQVKVGRGGRTEVWVGSLGPVAALTTGGTCVHTDDIGNLAAVITATVGS